jgi:1-acyl-sn-glycerol-3-phosphate acyltransferase
VNLFRKIWALWAVFIFLLLMFLSLPLVVFNLVVSPGARALRHNIWYLHHVFTPFFLRLVGIRMQVEGRKKLLRTQSYVIVGNHRSSLDFIINAHAYPGVFRFLAKQELKKIPVFGFIVGKMCLIVDRSSAMSRARSVVALKQQLAEGWSIFIYPEGSRNRTAERLAPFYDGAFRIAIQTGAPVAVQTLINIQEITGANGDGLQPGVVKVVWEDPIVTADMTVMDIPLLRETVENMMRNRIEAYALKHH